MALPPSNPFDYAERLQRRERAKPEPTEGDAILAAVRDIEREDLATAVRDAPEPDAFARVERLARQTDGRPSDIVGREDEVERSLWQLEFLSEAQENEVLRRWFGRNPRDAALAQDDGKAIGKIARSFNAEDLSNGWSIRATPEVEPTFGNIVTGLFRSLVGGFEQLKDGGALALRDWLPRPEYLTESQERASAESLLRRFRATQANIQASTPTFESPTASGVYSGAASLAQMAPALVASVATRSPYPAAMIAGAQTAAPAYGKYRARGGTTAEATVGAVGEGSVEAGLSLLPFGTVAAKFGRQSTGKFVAEFFGKELATEQLTTLAQDAIDTAVANPDKTWGEFWAERPAAAYETAIATLVATGTLGGLSAIASRSETREGARARAEAEGYFLDRLADGAADSKLRKRNPGAFQSMLHRLSEDMVADKLYVPASAVRSYMQSEGFEETEWWRAQADALAEAEATGGDLVIPLSEAMTHLSDRSTWNALRNDVRMSAGGQSRAETDTFGEEADRVDAELAALVEDRGNDPRSQLFAKAYEAISAGGYSGNAARVQAELVTERYATRAQRRGEALTGREFDRVSVERVLPERLKAAAKADATDLVINALRGGQPAATQVGPSLLEWIAARGGINDTGGDLAAIGLDQWHRGKAFRRKLVRDFDPQAALGGISGDGDYGLDTTFRAAIDAGYFPELQAVEAEAGPSTLDTQDFVDALSAELAGDARYAGEPVIDDMRLAADELRELLESDGFDPAAMSDSDIREAIERFEARDMGGRFYASGERGQIHFTEDGEAIIRLFKSRNLSTFLHESGHLYLEELREDASRPDANDQLKADWRAVEQWFAANKVPLEGGAIPVEAHELWARGFERYLLEGQAPSSALRDVFETVRSWLVAIYRRARNLDAPISDDIRRVMDRLLATDDAIATKREEQVLDPAFGSLSEAGMTQAEFAEYMDLVAQSQSAANSELLGKALARLKAQESARYKAMEVEVRAEVALDVDARPPMRALDLVRSAPLNQQWIVDRFGQDALGLMPAGVPKSYKKNGANPDAVAEQAGFGDGREMIETLMGLEKQRRTMRENGDKRSVRAATIDAETIDRMDAQYGDPFATGEVEAEALSSVHNDLQGEVLAAEVRALARRVGDRPTPYSMAREWARQKVRSGEVKDHLSGAALQQYRRAAARNATAAFDALAAGNYRVAFRHKQAQLVNNALVREAREASVEVEKAVARLDRIARKKTLPSVDQEYLEQAHALLEQVDLRKRSGAQVERQETFESWAAKREEEGYSIAVPRSFASTIGQTNWTKLSAENLLGLDDAVKQVMHLGRLKQTLRDRQEERELDALVNEAVTTIQRLEPRKSPGFADPTKFDDIKSGALGIGASLLKMDTIFERLDGSRAGAFHRVVWQPLSDAQAAEQQLIQEMRGELDEHLKKVPKKILATWGDKIQIDSLLEFRTLEPFAGPRSKLISMALNMGNESNAAKLAGGYGWRENEIMRVLDQELAPEEWQYVQRVWDTIEKLWPKIVEVEKRVNGVAPDKVRARRLNTSAGILRGGYFPVVYDMARDRATSQQQERNRDSLFENTYQRAATSRGFTKARTQVERPILLSLDVIQRHVAEVAHDITHREAVMQADRFLSDSRVLDAVDETMGQHISKLFRPWLQHIANQWAYDRAGVSDLENAMRTLRRNTTFVGMGYRVYTVITQLAGYTNSVERIGLKWFMEGLGISLRNPIEANRFAIERSNELKTRFATLDRDMAENARRVAGRTDVGALMSRYAYSGISVFDRLVSIPTWLGAYNKALTEGLGEEQAVYEADSAVLQSQGGGAAKDLSAIQRGRGPAGELGKALTLFYSFQSAQFNRLAKLYYDASDAKREGAVERTPEIAARAFVLVALVPVIGQLVAGKGPDEDNEEGWAEWAAKQSLYGLAAPLPFFRDAIPVTTAAVAGDASYPYRFTPIAGLGESMVRVGSDVRKVSEGEETTRATRNTLELIGYATGRVPGQGAASAQFIADVASGDAEPETMSDWWEGVTRGRIEEEQ
ncbi:acetyltransferase [Citromicrobium bathyomarinum]